MNMNIASFSLFKLEYKAGNKENWIFQLSETIADEIDIIENSKYGEVDLNPLIDVFDMAVNVFLANKDARNALELYQHLCFVFRRMYEKSKGTKNFSCDSYDCLVPGRVMVALYEIVRLYIDTYNINVENHIPLIVAFIRHFRKYIKEGRQPEKVHNMMVQISQNFPHDLSSVEYVSIDWYLESKLYCSPMKLTPYLMPILSSTRIKIPDGVVLVPYQNETTKNWGFKDKMTGHVVVPAQFDEIASETDWIDGTIWVRNSGKYHQFDRTQYLDYGKNLIKVDGVGYFYKYFNKKYYDTNWNVQTTKQEITYRYGYIVTRNFFDRETLRTVDKEMRPLADVSNCEVVKYIQEYSPRAVISAIIACLLYIFISQLMFLSDISVVNTWANIPGFANFLYILFIPIVLIAFPVMYDLLVFEKFPEFQGNNSSFILPPELVMSATLGGLVEFWSIMGVLALLERSGFWPVTGLIVCSLIGVVGLFLTVAGLSSQPKIKGMKLFVGSRLFWVIFSQIAVAANLAIAHYIFI